MTPATGARTVAEIQRDYNREAEMEDAMGAFWDDYDRQVSDDRRRALWTELMAALARDAGLSPTAQPGAGEGR